MPSDGLIKEVASTATEVVQVLLRNRLDIAKCIVDSKDFELFCLGTAQEIEEMAMDESWHSWGRTTIHVQTSAMEFVHWWQQRELQTSEELN